MKDCRILNKIVSLAFCMYTFSCWSQEGPAGVSGDSENRFWYLTNDLSLTNNQRVMEVLNKGGNTRKLQQTNAGKRPVFRNDAVVTMNGLPVMKFDGSNDGMIINSSTDMNLSNSAQDSKFFAIVIKTTTDISSRQCIYEEGGGLRGLNIYIFGGEIYFAAWNDQNDGVGSPWSFSYSSHPIQTDTEYIIGLEFDGNSATTGSIKGFLNGALVAQANDIGLLYRHSGAIGVGSKNGVTVYETGRSNGGADSFDGFMTEFIHYNRNLKSVERNLLFNYLSAKYDIPLSSPDYYTMDDANNGDYDFEVAGIGQDQLAENSVDGKGSGELRINNANDLDNEEYLMWGHNDFDYCGISNAPTGLNFRMSKLWRISETGDVGTVSIVFDMTDISYSGTSNLRLVVDNDDDFSDAVSYTISSTNNDDVIFDNVAISNGDYVTLASTDVFSATNLQTTAWTGNSSDWSDGSNWSNGVPDKSTKVVLSNGLSSYPVITDDVECFDVDIQSDGILEIANTGVLRVLSNWNNDGTYISNSGTVIFEGGCVEQIRASVDQTFYNLEIDPKNDVSLEGTGITEIKGYLSLKNKRLYTNDQLLIASDQDETARITEIPDGSSIEGSITMQRYIDAGATNWRFLSNPVIGADLEQYDDDFVTSGIPGTDWPNWPSASNPWPSMYFYDESIPGHQDLGFVAPTSTSNVLGVGQGVWVWCGDTITGTQPFIIDVTGPVNQGNISLPVSYTNNALTNDDGWNLVGNPYPSTIDWDSPNWTKQNLNSAIYVWNPDLGTYSSYVPGATYGTGIGTNDGSQFIASSQAFYVHASSGNPALDITEKCKINQDQVFLRPIRMDNNILKMSLRSNGLADEMVVRTYLDATNGFDGAFDALKLFSSGDPTMPQISTFSNNIDYSINSLNGDSLTQFYIRVQGDTNNISQLKMELFDFPEGCISITDLETQVSYVLDGAFDYSFQTKQVGIHSRFLVEFVPKPQLETTSVTCFGEEDAVLDLYLPTVFDGALNKGTDTIAQFVNSQNQVTINGLSEGWYGVALASSTVCYSSIMDSIYIDAPVPISVRTEYSQDTCQGCCEGIVAVTVSGGTAPYRITVNGQVVDNTIPITGLCPGMYQVDVLDAHNCEDHTYLRLEETITGIAEITQVEFEVLPNLVDDHLRIISDVSLESVDIVNILGELVLTSSSDLILGLNKLNQGTYLVRVKDSNGNAGIRKIVVQR